MIDEALRDFVRERAGDRCEYCRLPQHADEAKFHVEHIVARQHAPQRPNDADNLALACHRYNLYKGTNLSSVDPADGTVVPIFHPRRLRWEEHFELHGALIGGRSPTGRATARLLQFNARLRVELRERLLASGSFDASP